MNNPQTIFPRERWWWAGMIGLLIIASMLFYTGYDFGLPYVDHPDEPQFSLAAQMIRDNGSARPMALDAYPPGIITVNYLLLEGFHQVGDLPTVILTGVRLISITFGVLCVIPICLLGYQLTNPLMSLTIGFWWIITPLTVMTVRFAVADYYLTFFALTAVLLSYLSTVYNRSDLMTLGLISLMLAIVFKTQGIFLLPLVFGLPLLRWYLFPETRIALYRNVALNLLRLVLFLFWLLVLYPTLEANKIPNWVAPTDQVGLPDIPTLQLNLETALVHLAPMSVWAGLVVLYVLALLQRFRQQIKGLLVIVLVISALAWLVGISLFGIQSVRQLYALYGLCLILVLGGLNILLESVYRIIPRRFQLSAMLGGLIALIITGLPLISRDIQHIQGLLLPDSRVMIAQYMDSSLPPASHIATWDNHKTLNPLWGGIAMQHSFEFAGQANLQDRTLAEWQERNVQYAIVPSASYDEWGQDSAGVTLLKTFTSDQWRGPQSQVIYLNAPDVRLEESVGGITYLGYDINPTQVRAGDTLEIQFYWQAETPTSSANQLFLHLLDENQDIVAQLDRAPLFDVRRSTATWDDPEEVLISPVLSLPIPSDLPGGTYRLISGFYDPQTFTRLKHPDGWEAVEILQIETE